MYYSNCNKFHFITINVHKFKLKLVYFIYPRSFFREDDLLTCKNQQKKQQKKTPQYKSIWQNN